MYKRLALIPLAALALSACSLLPIGQRSSPTAAPTAVAELATATSAPDVQPTEVEAATAEPAPADPTRAVEATAPPATAGPLDDPAHIAAAKLVERDQVEIYKAFKNVGDVPAVVRTTPLEVKVGDVETFWVSDLSSNTNYTITARLRYAGPVALMYVDSAVDSEVEQADVERSAREFEERIYPRDREIFGEELSPGIDGDVRLTILNTPLRGAGGYFSSADGVVKQVNRYSNEREMFVIGINSYPIGSDGYGSTLAHEFQHMIEWNKARTSPSWFNEGMSTLAEDLNGYTDQGTALIHLASPDIQLTTWSSEAAQTGEHYGTSQLFMRYMYEQYAGDKGLAELIAADAGNNLDAFVPVAARKRPEITSFADLYADWAVANAINDASLDGGRYAYKLLPDTVRPEEESPGSHEGEVHQFGADYLSVSGPATITFDGADTTSLVGASPAEGTHMWWSKRGDDSLSTLTRPFDLTGVSQATLKFSTWYEIELNWDYAFVTVSTDGGTNWTPLQGNLTTNDDPQGANLGNGITGVSGSPGVETDKGTAGKWVEEQMDLSPYVGKQILLRFWMVQDAAYNAKGILIDNIRIPELNYADGGESGDGDWQAEGFVRTTGRLAQQWTLRLIETTGDTTSVVPVAVDEQGRATATLDGDSKAIFVVVGSTPFSTEEAPYRYELK